MLKLIVMSATYRQSSQAAPSDSRSTTRTTAGWPGRAGSGSTPRSSATTPWRSAACSSAQIGGPSVKPYQPAGYWVAPQLPHARVQRRPRARPVPPRALHLLAADVPAPEPAGLRRPDPRGMHGPAAAVEHAAPGPGPAERPDLRRGGARARRADRSARAGRTVEPGSTAPSDWRLARPPRPAEAAVLLRLLAKHQRAVPRRPDAAATSCWASASARAAGPRRRPSWRPGPRWPACS